MSQYELIKGFLNKDAIEFYIRDVKSLIDRFYTEYFLKEHIAYFSDQSENRESYAFAVSLDDNPPVLPALDPNLISQTSRRIATLNLKMSEILQVSRNSRLMLNVQIYRGNSKPVTKHYDGEYFDFFVDENGSLNIVSGLRPEKVAVCVLHNDSTGGTRIHDSQGNSQVIVGETGDLLVFDNVNCLHSVDELVGTSTRDDGILRMTIGWRSLDENVFAIRQEKIGKKLSIAESRVLHKDFLRSQWPSIYRSYMLENKKKAF